MYGRVHQDTLGLQDNQEAKYRYIYFIYEMWFISLHDSRGLLVQLEHQDLLETKEIRYITYMAKKLTIFWLHYIG